MFMPREHWETSSRQNSFKRRKLHRKRKTWKEDLTHFDCQGDGGLRIYESEGFTFLQKAVGVGVTRIRWFLVNPIKE